MEEEREAPESRLTITRKSPEDCKMRQILIDLDDKRFAALVFGKTATRAVTAGRHSVVVNNTWNKKRVEFDVAPGEHVKFRAASRTGKFTWFLVAVMGAGPMYVSIERDE